MENDRLGRRGTENGETKLSRANGPSERQRAIISTSLLPGQEAKHQRSTSTIGSTGLQEMSVPYLVHGVAMERALIFKDVLSKEYTRTANVTFILHTSFRQSEI